LSSPEFTTDLCVLYFESFLPPTYYSLILFAVKNKHLFTSNNEIHTYKTRNYLNFHLPTVNLTKFYKFTNIKIIYKGTYVSSTKAFSHLPRHIKILVNDIKCFKLSLKRFSCHHSFYSIEYYEHTDGKDT
jgi:cobalamin biosynthesis Co2+ chelatase CbiK